MFNSPDTVYLVSYECATPFSSENKNSKPNVQLEPHNAPKEQTEAVF